MTRQEKIDNILKLWAEGHTAKHIGELLGVTRNAVIGIVTRARAAGVDVDPLKRHVGRNGRQAGLSYRGTSMKRGPAPRVRSYTPRQRSILNLTETPETREFTLAEPSPPEKFRRWVPLIETEYHSCRYTKDSETFCNAKPDGVHYWCKEHRKVVYQPRSR